MAQVMAALAAILYFVESEFLSLVGGACGPNAAAMAESWADQRYHSTRDVFLRFARIGACSRRGISTGGGLVKGLRADGFKVERGLAGDWPAFLKSKLIEPARAAVIVELAAAHNLRDAITGAGMDAGPGLAYHYICAYLYHPGGHSVRAGRELPPGWWCADGDSDATNPVVHGHRTRVAAGHSLQFYPVSVLALADPCDLIAVYPRVKLPKAPKPPTERQQKRAADHGWDPADESSVPKPTPVVVPQKGLDMNLFDKANAGLPLTPLQRAFLRFLEGAIVATVVSAMPAIAAAMASQTPDWGNVSRIFVATFAVVLLLSLSKWAKAHGDAPLGQVADEAAGDIEHGLPNDVKVEPSSVPDLPAA